MTVLTSQETLQAIIDGKDLEFKHSGFKEWTRLNPLDNPLSLESIFKGGVSFRLAQEMITIGDVSFPKPELKPLKDGDEYWVADPTVIHYTLASRWVGDKLDKLALNRGLLHKSRENAIAHAKALIKLSGGNVNE